MSEKLKNMLYKKTQAGRYVWREYAGGCRRKTGDSESKTDLRYSHVISSLN